MQIVIAPDRMTATVGEEVLKVGAPISWVNDSRKFVSGTLLILALIDKKDMNSPWMYVKENKTNEAEWKSINIWSEERGEPIKKINFKKKSAPVVEPELIVKPEPTPDDFIPVASPPPPPAPKWNGYEWINPNWNGTDWLFPAEPVQEPELNFAPPEMDFNDML